MKGLMEIVAITGRVKHMWNVHRKVGELHLVLCPEMKRVGHGPG